MRPLILGIMPIDRLTTVRWPSSLQSELRSSRPHILLLTRDENLSRRARKAWLAVGFVAFVFSSLEEAWSKLRHYQIDLVIVDHRTVPKANWATDECPETTTETTPVPMISWRQRFFHQHVFPTFSLFQISLMHRAVEILDQR